MLRKNPRLIHQLILTVHLDLTHVRFVFNPHHFWRHMTSLFSAFLRRKVAVQNFAQKRFVGYFAPRNDNAPNLDCGVGQT